MATSMKLTVKKVANSGNIETNKSKIKVTVDITTTGESKNLSGDTKGCVEIDGGRVASLDGKKFYQNSTTTIYSKTHEVQHEEDGTKTATVHVWFDTKIAAEDIEATKTVVLDTIPRASALEVPPMFYGKSCSIGIDVLVDGAVSDISYTFGTKSGVLAEKTADTELEWTPPLELAEEYPNTPSGTGVFTVTTYVGETMLGTRTFPFYVLPGRSLAPVILDAKVTPKGTSLNAHIKGVTHAAYEMSAKGQRGAEIVLYSLQFAGQTASGKSGETGKLTAAGEQEPVVTVRDSRGMTATQKLPPVMVYDYFAPTLTVAEVGRGEGDTLVINVKADYADVGGKNAVTLQMRSRESNAGWGDVYTDLSAEQTNVLSGFAENKSYEVEISAVDGVGSKNTVVFTIPTAEVAFHIKPGGKGAAFGKYATDDDTLDIGWKTLKVNGKTLEEMIGEGGNHETDAFGIESVVESSLDGGENIVTFSDGSTVTVRNGSKGSTPQRGADYWTAADIQAMVADAVSGVLAQKATILETVYPVGALYMSTVSTSPKTLFGFGTWERIQDRFLLAAGSAYTAGSTGGEATHKLTVNEMPTHRHRLRCGSTAGTDRWVLTDVKVANNQYAEFRELDYIENSGGDQPHNNMPPYLAVYVWQRTA